MSRQDKATTERHARTLRELIKRPENKLCADCKRNDPRWASWNLGVFLCIRCSGIHRSMGTHISRVKSVDLDIWTPEQMESIQKWGNRRANIYWEAHLKAGHIPPEHKMDSFIRSKYETRRWAMDGPPPPDPSIFDEPTDVQTSAAEPTPAPSSSSRPTLVDSISTPPRQAAPPITTRQPQAHQLLSSAVVAERQSHLRTGSASGSISKPPAPRTQIQTHQQPAQPKAPENDLFSLDFHAPASTTAASPTNGSATSPTSPTKKDVKQDILSLFNSPTSVQPPAQASPWGSFAAAPAQPAMAQPQSMMGATGWGASSGWGGAPQPAAAPVMPAQSNIWGATPSQPQMQSNMSFFDTSGVWGAQPAATPATGGGGIDLLGTPSAGATATTQQQKKDDAFGDLWGDFK